MDGRVVLGPVRDLFGVRLRVQRSVVREQLTLLDISIPFAVCVYDGNIRL